MAKQYHKFTRHPSLSFSCCHLYLMWVLCAYTSLYAERRKIADGKNEKQFSDVCESVHVNLSHRIQEKHNMTQKANTLIFHFSCVKRENFYLMPKATAKILKSVRDQMASDVNVRKFCFLNVKTFEVEKLSSEEFLI